MKKLLSIALALVMVMALSVTCFAAITTGGKTSNNVTVSYETENNTANKIYAADISWSDLTVTYSYGKNWNPETMKYDVASTGDWSNDDKVITITINNKSNASIWSDVTYTANNGITGTVTGDGEIEAATPGTTEDGTPGTQTVTVTFSGTPNSLTETDGGSISVALSETAPVQG